MKIITQEEQQMLFTLMNASQDTLEAQEQQRVQEMGTDALIDEVAHKFNNPLVLELIKRFQSN